MSPDRRMPLLAAAFALTLAAALAAPASTHALGVSPVLVDAAAEVWGVIARPDNPVWPGWNASDTPLLLYLPGRQDLLIGHPSPPPGYRPYTGPLRFAGASMVVRDDSTLITMDGQNTSRDVNGVRTLVVADPLSNLRVNMGALLQDPRPGDEHSPDHQVGSRDAAERAPRVALTETRSRVETLPPPTATPNNQPSAAAARAQGGAIARTMSNVARARVSELGTNTSRCDDG